MGRLHWLIGGAVAGWTDLQQVLHASLDGIAAFGVANDIGLALGLSEITELTLHITNEKFVQHYRLQELVLELATMSILYRAEIYQGRRRPTSGSKGQ